ncbi:hypothetical protein BDF21DRAFT_414391, partial [Thamnidium elegans]
MYERSPRPENRDPDSNKELASINSTQKLVSDYSTLEPASCVAQKYIPVDSKENPVSMDTTQNTTRTNYSPPSPISQLYDLTDLTQIPTAQASAKSLCSPVVKQDLESLATTQTIEKNLKVSLPSQIVEQGPSSHIVTDAELTTLSSYQPIQNDTVMFDSSLTDDTKDTHVDDIVLPDKVNEETASTQVANSDKNKLRFAPYIKTRESRKRKSTTNVNYKEQTENDAMFIEEEKSVKKKPATKKTVAKKPAAKKPTEKKVVGKKHAVKISAEKEPTEKELAGKELAEEAVQIKPKGQRKSMAKLKLNEESGSDVVKVNGKRKKKLQDEDEEREDMPKKKVTRTKRTKEAIKIEKEEKKEKVEKAKEREDEEQKEDEEVKLNRLLQSKTSFLTEIDMKELIPQWLEALPEEDKLELASLLPEPDCEIKEGKHRTIREGFGSNSSHLYDAAAQWQNVLALGGFEEDDREPESQVLTDSFKDENYERNWGERVSRDQKSKSKVRGRPKKN